MVLVLDILFFFLPLPKEEGNVFRSHVMSCRLKYLIDFGLRGVLKFVLFVSKMSYMATLHCEDLFFFLFYDKLKKRDLITSLVISAFQFYDKPCRTVQKASPDSRWRRYFNSLRELSILKYS